MAKRFTDTELWDKEWFMKLSCKQKCLVKMVRDKCDLSGVWSPNWIIANAYIGELVTEKDLLDIDGGRQFKKIQGGKICCIGFIEFQYGKLTEKSPVHRKILNLLTSNQIPYQHPINRVKEEEEDKEEEKEVEEVKEKKPKIEKVNFAPFVTMTDEEHSKLVEEHGENLTANFIKVLDNYKGSKNKKYASDYRAILSWVVAKVLKEQSTSGEKVSHVRKRYDEGEEIKILNKQLYGDE